mgnify:CR=1 FL=1
MTDKISFTMKIGEKEWTIKESSDAPEEQRLTYYCSLLGDAATAFMDIIKKEKAL